MASNMERAAPDSPGNGPLLKKSLLGGADTSQQAPRDGAVAQAKIELLVDDIGCNVGILIATLNVALAMRDAGDTTGLLYALRRAKAYWRAISASAADLVAAEAPRQSLLRQREGGR